jgi:hypothetical protein
MSNSHCPNPWKKQAFKGVKMTTSNGPSILESSQHLCYPAARFDQKECLPVWGWSFVALRLILTRVIPNPSYVSSIPILISILLA